jgi:arabinan endo-1,5-alpha-L-arabinosidase
MLTWSAVDVPWGADGVSGVGNDKAFITPEVTKVKKGGAEVDLPAFNAMAWSAKGNPDYNVDGNMWAPDVIYNKALKKWCMYLSVNGDSWYSSIIMLTSDFIVGPYTYQAPVVISGFRSSNYKETDLEIVLGAQETMPARYAPSDNYGNHWPNCIDPCVFYDEEGKLWMSYGSWSGGIFMLELDEETGLRDYDVNYTVSDTSDPYFGKKIAGGHYVSGEASYIEYVGGYYFLFMSYGGFSAADGYQMRVFRSEKPDGPYVDSKGSSAVYNSYQLNFGADANDGNRGVNIFGAYGEWGGQTVGSWSERSQGHNSVIAAEDGRTYLVYHTRFQNQGEGHAVRVHQLYQNEDGWLVAAPFEYTGEMAKSAQIASQQLILTADIPGKYKLLVHHYGLDHKSKALAKPVEVELTADGKITGAYTGSWSIKEGTSYININIGTEYKGVMVLQTLEPDNTQVPSFTCLRSATGVTLWGYKYTTAE